MIKMRVDPIKIKICRKNSGLTQAEVARKLGVSAQYVSQYERGLRHPKPSTLARLADAIGVPSSVLTCDIDPPKQDNPGINSEQKYIIALFEQLNASGKAQAIIRIREMAFVPEYQAEAEKEGGCDE